MNAQAEQNKPDIEVPDDPRPEWQEEDDKIDGAKPDLEEIEGDPSGFE
jgi:hypothetical protein